MSNPLDDLKKQQEAANADKIHQPASSQPSFNVRGPSLSDAGAQAPTAKAAAEANTAKIPPEPPKTAAPPAAAFPDVDKTGIDILASLTPERLEELAHMIEERQRARTVKRDLKKHITDFRAVQERDIFNLDIPIEAISHDAPDFMAVELRDQEYAARWIFNHPQRIGTMKAAGFTYVTAADLAEDLKLEISEDENSHFHYIDTVLMKVPKRLYFGQLRKNFLRSRDAIDPSRIHAVMKQETNAQMANMDDDRPGFEGRNYAQDFNKYNSKGVIKAYRPGIDL